MQQQQKLTSQDFTRANTYSMPELLQCLGFSLVRKHGTKLFFENPFHNHNPQSKDPKTSFKVEKLKGERWYWYDYTNGTSGTLIDLIVKLQNCNAKQAYNYIISYFEQGIISNFSFAPLINNTVGSKSNHNKQVEIQSVKPLSKNTHLINYTLSRKISLKTAQIYLKEVYYTMVSVDTPKQQKPYYALGFQNDLGGFALRNEYTQKNGEIKSYKLATHPNAISTIQGKVGNTVCLFEGFFDFLSCLEYYKTTKLKSDCIILNGCGLVGGVLPNLEKYETINCFFDNDTQSKAGEKAFEQVQNAFGSKAKNQSEIYKGYKDFNDFLCGKPL